jgi:hypothetical protein
MKLIYIVFKNSDPTFKKTRLPYIDLQVNAVREISLFILILI